MKKHLVSITLIFLACLLFVIPHSQQMRTAQIPALEVSCPTGATALPAGIVINPATGKIRQLICMDSTGNLNLPVASLNFTGNFTLSNSGQTISFNGNNLTLSSFGGTNIQLNNPVALTTVAFASLGAVPVAGVFKFCTDCTTAATCAGAGAGHLAVSNGTNWTCQ